MEAQRNKSSALLKTSEFISDLAKKIDYCKNVRGGGS
jgi:hypothetical protein